MLAVPRREEHNSSHDEFIDDELLRNGAEPAIVIDHLQVIRGKLSAVQDICVRIARGTITGLLGPSGSGKTTLMRCIVGTQIVARGTVTVLGHPAESRRLRHRVGYMPQHPTSTTICG